MPFVRGRYALTISGVTALVRTATADDGASWAGRLGAFGPMRIVVITGQAEGPTEEGTYHRLQGDRAAAVGRFDDAFAAYGRALAIQPRDLSALMKAADLAFELGQLRRAAEYYERAVEVQPRFIRDCRGGWILTERAALCRLALGEFQQAEHVLDEAGILPAQREETLQRLTDLVSRIDDLRAGRRKMRASKRGASSVP